MSNPLLTLSRGTKVIDLYSWVSLIHTGWEALSGIEGFGMPDQSNNWSESIGDGAVYRGSRVLPREVTIPLVAEHNNRAGLDKLLSDLAVVLSPKRTGTPRLKYRAPDGDIWYLDVIRESGGDYVRVKGSNQRTYLKSSIVLKAGRPFWIRESPETLTLRQDDSGEGLMPNLAELQLSASQVFGSITPENVGDVEAWPQWTLAGPLTSATLTGPQGQVLQWTGTMIAGESRHIDAQRGTIVDENGDNKFDELGVAPQFWAIPDDEQAITINTEGADGNTYITASWQPRKWSMV